MERAKGFEPSAQNSQIAYNQCSSQPSKSECTQIRAHNTGPACPELAKVVSAWSKLPAPLKAAILAIVQSSSPGEPCEETVSQGGGVSTLLSGGDERSEPESQIKFHHGIQPPAVSEGKTTAGNNQKE
jgi:hypothetical protein